jgi:hypothetical protein
MKLPRRQVQHEEQFRKWNTLLHLHRFSAVLEALYECQPPEPLSPIELTLALMFATKEKPRPVLERLPVFSDGHMCWPEPKKGGINFRL